MSVMSRVQVGTPQLSHIDGVAKSAPVCRIVAEPVHSGVIRPVQVPRHPIGRDVPGPPEVWTLQI